MMKMSWLSWYAMLMTLIGIVFSPEPGRHPNGLDMRAKQLALAGHDTLARIMWRMSATVLHSPHARMRLGEALTHQGRIEDAWDEYFPAVYSRPELGLEAGLQTLRHARTENEIGMAASYFDWATQSSHAAEAHRFLAHIALGAVRLPQDERLRRALREYRQAAELGDAEGRLVVGLASWLGIGMQQDKLLGCAWIMLAARSDDDAVAKMARIAIRLDEDVMRRMLSRILNAAANTPAKGALDDKLPDDSGGITASASCAARGAPCPPSVGLS